MNHSFNYIATLVLMAVSLAGCTPKGHSDDEAATFTVTRIEGPSTYSKYVPGFSLPTAKLYNFKACLIDRRDLKPLRNAPFSIEGSARPVSARADDAGCVNWQEEIPFNPLSDEKYLTVERVIRATGIAAGARRIRVAINPWHLGSDIDFIDLDRGQAPKEQLLTAKESVEYIKATPDPKPLTIVSLGISNSPEKSAGSVVRKLRFLVKPGVLLKNLNGAVVAHPLKAANLKASVRLYSINSIAGEARRSEVSRDDDIELSLDGDFYRFEYIPIIKTGNRSSRYELAVELTPVNGPVGLKAFNGLYTIGDQTAMTGASSLPAVLIDANYVTAPTAPNESPFGSNGKTAGQAFGNPPPTVQPLAAFEVGEIKVSFLGVEAETTLVRKIGFRMTTCITDTSNGGKPATDVDFVVETGNADLHAVITPTKLYGVGNDGCITWVNSITHRFYEPERFYLIPVSIKHSESGFIEKRIVGVNPWDRMLIGFDSITSKDMIDTFNRRPSLLPSRLTTSWYGWETIKTREYSVDEFLNLKIMKSVQFRIPVSAQRDSSIVAGKSAPIEPIRNGIWGFRAMVYLPVQDSNNEKHELYIPMRGEYQLVKSSSGEIKTQVDFDVSDPRIMRARGFLVFEVLPIDERKLSSREQHQLRLDDGHSYQDVVDTESRLIAPTFAGPTFAGDETGTSTALPTDMPVSGSADNRKGVDPRVLGGRNFDDMLVLAKASQEKLRNQMQSLRSLPVFLRNSNLDFVSLRNEAQVLAQNPGLAAANKGLAGASATSRLLAFMNFKFPKSVLGGAFSRFYDQFQLKDPVTVDQLQALVEGSKELDRAMAGHLCMAFMQEIVTPALPKAKPLFTDCLKEAAREFAPGGERGRGLFEIDQVVRVFDNDGGKVGPVTHPSMRFNVGHDVSMNSSYSYNEVGQLSFSPTALIGSIPVLNWISLSGTKQLVVGKNINEGASLASGFDLTMEHVELNIGVKHSESCLAVRIRPEFWEARAGALRGSRLSGEALTARLSRGLFICTGVENTKAMNVREQYYGFAPAVLDGVRLDKGDLANYPYLIAMRGTADYLAFLKLIAAKKSHTWEIPESFRLGGYPLDRLQDAYAKYRARLPSQPGFYIRDRSESVVPAPETSWWSGSYF